MKASAFFITHKGNSEHILKREPPKPVWSLWNKVFVAGIGEQASLHFIKQRLVGM